MRGLLERAGLVPFERASHQAVASPAIPPPTTRTSARSTARRLADRSRGASGPAPGRYQRRIVASSTSTTIVPRLAKSIAKEVVSWQIVTQWSMTQITLYSTPRDSSLMFEL